MKIFRTLASLVTAAACLMPLALTGCGTDLQNYRYRYDLSEYITLGQYKELPVVVADTTVTEADVQQQIDATISYFATRDEIDRAPQAGDLVVYDCTVVMDGETQDALSGDDLELTLGFDHLGSDIEALLLTASVGDTITADRVFDNSILHGIYAGKTVTYTITVEHFYALTPQPYDDLFVKAYLSYNSVEEYEAALRASLEQAAADTNMRLIVQQTWDAVLENTTVISYPEKEMEEMLDQLEQELRAYTSSIGLNYEDYIGVFYGKKPDEFREYAKDAIKDRMKEDMIIYAIARAENLTVTESQYRSYESYFCENFDVDSLEELEQLYEKEALLEIVLADVVKEFVANSAVPTEAN